MGWAAYALVRVWVSWTDPEYSEVVLEPGVTTHGGSGSGDVSVAPVVLTWSPGAGFGVATVVEVDGKVGGR